MRILGRAFAAIALAAFASLVAFVNATIASAVPPRAALNYYYYIESYNPSTAYNWGCVQGQGDNTHQASSLVVLDFGQQTSTGTTDPLTGGVAFSFAQIESTAENFAKGYYTCVTGATQVTLGLGVNNYLPPSSTLGRAWANEVNRAAFWVSTSHIGQVVIVGSNDIESWGDETLTLNWITGYAAVTGRIFVNIGSADGCLLTTTSGYGSICNTSPHPWNQYGYWYASWGSPVSTVTPELYLEGQENQWAWISEYGYKYATGAISFYGPLDEYNRSTPQQTYLTPTVAWNDLWTALQSLPGTGLATFPFAAEQH